ncbi:CU044_2847 family protein [Spongiimicrobium salis]|uniref:CU044_2847 family protein n=1 Tax=Spongiimicrobium salis TaxID=1667022 RepID=UPI00374DD1C9
MNKNDVIEINLGESLMYLEIKDALSENSQDGAFEDVAFKESKVYKATKKKIEESLDSVKYVGKLISEKLNDIKPDKTEIEFGIKFNTNANVVIASIAQEANFKVKLTWTSNESQ